MTTPAGTASRSALCNDHLNLLISLGHDLLTVPDLSNLLNSTLQRVIDYTSYNSGSIMLYNNEDSILEVRACIGDAAVQVGTRVPNLDRSVAGHALMSGQPLVLQGLGEDIGVTWRDYTRYIPSVVCLPLLVSEQQAIGVLVLKSTVAIRTLDSTDLETLRILASQLAAVVENARLHAERNQLLADLATRERRLHELVGDLLTAQEEERRRLAYDLHDGLAQVAASAYQHLQALSAQYKPRAARAREDLRQAMELSRRTVREAREMMAGLRPTALDDLGLTVALRLEVESLTAKGWEITFEELQVFNRLPSLTETTLFRVCQELLKHVHKHGETNQVHVSIGCTDASVTLTVEDWGRGYQDTDGPQHQCCGEPMALYGVTERINLLGGSCSINTTPGKGTTIAVSLPLSM